MEIKSLNKLASILSLPKEYLIDLASRRSSAYHPYWKKKKSGKYRTIDNPSEEIKIVQTRINERILAPEVVKLPNFMHGARNGRSVRTNIEVHLRAEALLSADLKDCFPSIKPDHVYKMFKIKFGCVPKVAKILTKLTMRNHKLPQGAPTSSGICNLVLEPLCVKLDEISRSNSCAFSQYLDDLYFSGSFPSVSRTWPLAESEIEKAGFTVNKKKIILAKRGHRMRIMNINVDRAIPSVPRSKRKKIERDIMRLNNLNKYEIKMDKHGPKRVYEKDKISGKISAVIAINQSQGEKIKEKFSRKITELKNSES